MVAPAAARRTAFAVPPHLEDPSGLLAIWYTDPPGAVIQFTRPAEGSLPIVEWLVGPGLAQLLDRFPGPQRLVIVMDLGLMKGRDRNVRPILMEAGKALRPRIERTMIVPPQGASAIYLASLQASVSLLRVFGVPVEVQSLSSALRSLSPARG